MVNAPSDAGPTQPGFTVWPAQSPARTQFTTGNGGTEYFLSSNAADEATNSGSRAPAAATTSTSIVVWTLTNTSSLNTATPALSLTNQLAGGEPVRRPAEAEAARVGHGPDHGARRRASASTTRRHATIAGIGCWRLLFAAEPAHNEVISRPDSNDTRMQQVMYANGKLWGALDTALNPDGGAQRAGIAWYIVNPSSNKVALQGYLGATGHDFTYPAIGVTASGRGVMAFTATGDTLNPSAAYAADRRIAGRRPPGTSSPVAGRCPGRRLHELQVPGRQPAADPLG